MRGWWWDGEGDGIRGCLCDERVGGMMWLWDGDMYTSVIYNIYLYSYFEHTLYILKQLYTYKYNYK